jgi:hypothetical protein
MQSCPALLALRAQITRAGGRLQTARHFQVFPINPSAFPDPEKGGTPAAHGVQWVKNA